MAIILDTTTGTITAGASVITAIPPASIMPYAGAIAPSGWMLCDGSAIDRVVYATLYAIIGTTYGVGDGFSTFNLPDLRGRAVIALDNMGGTSANRVTDPQADTLGGFMGEESHQLTTAEGPSHSHTVSATSGSISTGTENSSLSHYHNENMGNANVGISAWYQDNTAGGNLTVVNNEDTTDPNRVYTDSASPSAHTHSLTVNVTGTTNTTAAAVAHNNLQPTFALNYIIKVV